MDAVIETTDPDNDGKQVEGGEELRSIERRVSKPLRKAKIGHESALSVWVVWVEGM